MLQVEDMYEIKLIAALLHDVVMTREVVQNYMCLAGECSSHEHDDPATLWDTTCSGYKREVLESEVEYLKAKYNQHGMRFLTSDLPSLGKALDRALAGQTNKLEVPSSFEKSYEGRPLFLDGIFKNVFDIDGKLLPCPCVKSVEVLRQVLYLFYKYELPYTDEQERAVIDSFKRTEDDLDTIDATLDELSLELQDLPTATKRERVNPHSLAQVVREARIWLYRLFSRFDPRDIDPCHGPGAVAGRQKLWAKYKFTNVAKRITDYYPFDEYFCSSLGHVCDRPEVLNFSSEDLPARVILVPKDSRGPRLISCEPVDFQWVQGGLRKAIVQHVESHYLTKGRVNFTSQAENRSKALTSSMTGTHVTLDLKDASDRVSDQLVRLLFPPHLYEALGACRSLSTVLPDGQELRLRKFAPMGSSLCFPIMALTIWAVLTAAAPDEDTRKDILVYGDDVIVPRGYTRDAIEALEAVGLMVNRDKSCTTGLFRESCGMDAFNGTCVTPVRLRTVWSSSQSPNVYTSWIAYANQFYDRRYYSTYERIVGQLHAVYGAIPSDDMNLTCPSLREVSQKWLPRQSRFNRNLQKREWKVWDTKAPVVKYEDEGYRMLLRYFSECANDRNRIFHDSSLRPYCMDGRNGLNCYEPFCVRSYTRRKTSKLVRRWR